MEVEFYESTNRDIGIKFDTFYHKIYVTYTARLQ